MFTKLNTFNIPSSVTSIGERVFRNNSTSNPYYSLKTIYCHLATPPTLTTDIFDDTTYQSAQLYVPYGSKEAYQSADYWKAFKEIIELPRETRQCSAPVISIENGMLHFTNDTPESTFTYNISCSTDPAVTEGIASLFGGNFTFKISAYASAPDYDDSEVTTKTFVFNNMQGDFDGDGEITISDITSIIQLYLKTGAIK